MGSRIYAWYAYHFRIENILFLFWSVFWLLNGLDKFFDGTPSTHGAYGRHYVGWFGTNRLDKFTHYFERLELGPDAASGLAACCNYGFGGLEVLLGTLFAYILVMQRTEGAQVRLAFRGSMLIFLAFSAGDILFGDRMELWEHGTFMILALLTYRFYLDRQDERDDVVGLDRAIADLDEDGSISTAELKAFVKRRVRSEP